jgi:hypothetical protein
MKVDMNEAMFEALTETSMEWGERWREKLDRFECVWGDAPYPSLDWSMAYWVGNNPASMILARSWLLDEGHDFEIVWDMAEHAEGDWSGYAILTNYRSASWRGQN